MGLRVDVRIDSQRDAGRLPLPPGLGVDLLHLALRLRVEREEARGDAGADLLVRLADAREDDPVRREPRLEAGAQLSSRHDVRSRAERREELQNREVRVGLRRVADQMRDHGERAVERVELLLDRRPAVNVDRRPLAARDLGETHAVAGQLVFFTQEPRHDADDTLFACHPERSEGSALVEKVCDW